MLTIMKPNIDKNPVITFILNRVDEHPSDITKLVMKKFGISRQAINRYMQELVKNGLLTSEGQTRNKTYHLKPIHLIGCDFQINNKLEEHRIWRENFSHLFTACSRNLIDICQYGFSEMFNNAIDHSEGINISVLIAMNAINVEIVIKDDGVGIFDKIKNKFGLEDARHAILELSKGKLTTDPERHTGEGIFFTTRMFDDFFISANQLRFSHFKEGDDWLTEKEETEKGTTVLMRIALATSRTTKEIFDKYAAEENDFGFTKTIVPVNLLKYGEENLVSRSQAKRLLARFEKFREIILNFKNVANIGPAFADEIFRVFKKQHPHIRLLWIYTNKDVEKIIQKALKQDE